MYGSSLLRSERVAIHHETRETIHSATPISIGLNSGMYGSHTGSPRCVKFAPTIHMAVAIASTTPIVKRYVFKWRATGHAGRGLRALNSANANAGGNPHASAGHTPPTVIDNCQSPSIAINRSATKHAP